jgi:hypothetical protein
MLLWMAPEKCQGSPEKCQGSPEKCQDTWGFVLRNTLI